MLDGVRVVELGVWVAGPGAGGVMADWGADVIKVEAPAGDPMRRMLAVAGGADFIKTSTGKIQPAATLPVALVMLEAIRDFHDRTGRMVGMKPAGGVRTAKQAIQHLVVVNETLGPDWLTPDWFRLGASSLLNDCLMQLAKERTGRYQSGDYFTKD